jgi:pimeloyl-ACP methyl ester carboxylesterase
MKKVILAFSFFILLTSAFSQNYEKIVVDKNDPVTGYYLAVAPKGNIEGVLVLFPGFGEKPEDVLPETKLHNIAFNNNILTLIVPFGNKIYTDAPTITNINRALTDSIKRMHLNPEKFVIGGFSAGGTIAMRYVELCKEKPELFPVKPQAVFTIDSPIDLVDLSKYFDRELERNFSDAGMNEAVFIQGIMKDELKGTPETNFNNYVFHSPFTRELKQQGNEKYLMNIPVRLYHDVDLVWQLKNRRRSAFDNNVASASELIARLMLAGHEKAELMIAKQPGYRSNGMRHTHSWSIVDEVEFIQWMKQVVKS